MDFFTTVKPAMAKVGLSAEEAAKGLRAAARAGFSTAEAMRVFATAAKEYGPPKPQAK